MVLDRAAGFPVIEPTLPADTLAHLTAVLGGPLKGSIGTPATPSFTVVRLP